jgi:HEPN domain-containing protein
VAVYHCQQAAEKAVKAFLVHRRKPYERTHDIEVLTDLARELDANFSKLAEAADALTPYATRFRYPNATFAVESEPSEYNEVVTHAQTVYDFVLNLLPSEARP